MGSVKQRRRALASERRAGAYLRRRAVEQQLEYLNSNRRLVFYLFVLWAVVVPNLWWPVFDPFREFALGAWTASVLWSGVLLVWQMSGVGHLQLGMNAEQWTAQELRKLRKQGWLLINNVHFRKWDIDHVLIGPAGVVIVETKGGRTEWSEEKWTERLRQAARQAQGNADDTRRLVQTIAREVPVRPAVALWPSGKGVRSSIDSVEILPGLELRNWVESLPVGALDQDQVNAMWERIADSVERRDEHDLEKDGPPPRTFDEWSLHITQYVVGCLAGMLLLGPAVELAGGTVGVVVLLVIGAIAGLASRRVQMAQRLLIGFAMGTAIVMVTLLGVIAIRLLG